MLRFRISTLWLGLFLSLLAGLGLSRLAAPGILPVILLLPLAIISLPGRKPFTLMFVALFGVMLGCWRGGVYADQLSAYEPLYYRTVSLRAVALEDAVYNSHKQLAFSANRVTLDDGEMLKGKIQLSGFGINAVFQGDELMAKGKLYPGYTGYQGRISFGKLEVVLHHPTVVSNIRRKFVAGMQNALPEPLAPFAMGLLVGQRATLPADVKQDLLMVGLTHIIAVSGYNLTIILQASRKVLGRRSKRISTFLSVGLIGVFLLLAGSSPSIVRAAIVSMLSIATAYYGRSIKPLNLIMFAAVITAWANPAYIWGDVSWYLSFLAFLGVMILSPLVQARLKTRFFDSLVGGVALESICAEIMTLPFVLFTFGQMSRIGLLANVLVVTLIPLAMLLSLIAGLAGMFVPAVAGWLAWPAAIVLNYMLDTAHLLARLPHVFVEGIGLSLAQMLLLYAATVMIMFILWRKIGKSSIITDMTEQKAGSLLT
jgi:ComEC/Rec2-related protein